MTKFIERKTFGGETAVRDKFCACDRTKSVPQCLSPVAAAVAVGLLMVLMVLAFAEAAEYTPQPPFDWAGGQAPHGWNVGGWKEWGSAKMGESMSFVQDPDNPGKSMLVIDPLGGNDRYGIDVAVSAVKEGMRYILRADTRTEGRRSYIYIEFRDADGNVITDPRYKTRSSDNREWETIHQSLVAPSNAAFVYLRVYVNRFQQGDSVGKTYFRNVELEEIPI